MNGLEVLIAGGGIGGLAAAIALRNAGNKVQVFERAPKITEVGAGLSLWANATRALEQLGLGRAVEELSTPSMSGGTFTWDGRLLVGMTNEVLDKRFPRAVIVFHRADLIEALERELGSGVIRCGAGCTGFEQDAHGVTITLEGGERVKGDLLVGADGIKSVVRRTLGRPSELRYAGYTAWRGVVRLDRSGLPSDGSFWGLYIGRGAQVGIVPVSGGRVYWFATANVPAGERSGPNGHHGDLAKALEGWAEPIHRIIRATPEEAVLRNDIFDLEPIRDWSEGRVTLLGDAAHATTPNMGQGACMALEDAVVLARSLSEASDIPEGLRRYAARRAPRTNRVVSQSRSIGRVLQLQNPLLCWLRDRALSMVPIERQLESFAWLLEYDGLRDAQS
jgi:2-polyprenyl-6-methoxyphenol hydroxylase-like FAD-dependent oxidoreductase